MPDIARQLFHPADDAKADVVREKGIELEPQVSFQQHHQRADFGGRTFPVFDRERVEGQHVDAETRRRLDRVAYGIDPRTVPFDPWEVPLRCPPAVAVHDDGDVGRKLLVIHLPGERLVRVAGRNPRQELLERHLLECTFEM